MQTCRAVRIHRFGGPEVLAFDEISVPEPGSGEVVIRVHAASVNPVDYKMRSGSFPILKPSDLPAGLGRDAAGAVEICGEGVRGLKPGDGVFCSVTYDRGTYTEMLCVKELELAPKPGSLDFVQAAAVPLAGLTAWQGLFDHGGLQARQRVLIHGGSGGVGHFAVQFAKSAGAWVATTVSDRDIGFARELGADEVIDYRHQRFEQIARDIDLVLDLLGGATQERSWSVLKQGGIIVSTLQKPDEATARERQARGTNFMVQPNGGQLREIARLIDQGRVRPMVSAVVPFAEVQKAHRIAEDEHPRGKVVLRMGG